MTALRPTTNGVDAPRLVVARPLRAIEWHRPLLVLAVAMGVLALASTLGMLIDDRQVTGLSVWSKPLKFALSTLLYAVTLSWLIGQTGRSRRVARAVGTVSAILLAVELVIITAYAVLGETSHFNITTPLHTAAWAVMAVSISTLWGLTFVLAIILFRSPLGDAARTLSIRSGILIAIVGMGLAFLMTGPKGDQIENYQGVIGAHTVGVADGGPGLPVLGWSTVAGDLRIPHFVGMHALQVLPLLAILLELASRRVAVLADRGTRLRLVALGAAGYVAVLALVTVQALAGESIVQPSTPTLVVASAIGVALAGGIGTVLVRGRRRLTAA